jgi:hypothetical protein
LVAVGTGHGEVQILRVDDDSNAIVTLPLKLQRPCNTVAFNSTGLLAVGLDKVRNDACLQIWDVNQRLSEWDTSKHGFNSLSQSSTDPSPFKKLEPTTFITSVRFYEDQPQTLIAGIKDNFLKVHDLRGKDVNNTYKDLPTDPKQTQALLERSYSKLIATTISRSITPTRTMSPHHLSNNQDSCYGIDEPRSRQYALRAISKQSKKMVYHLAVH